MTDATPRRCRVHLLAPLAALALALLGAATASAQRLDSLAVGTRIRVIPRCIECDNVIGNYETWVRDSLVVHSTAGELALPRSFVSVVEVSRGKNRVRGAWRGALQWGISGALLGALVGASSGGYGVVNGRQRTHDVLLGIGIGVVSGGAVGAIAGAATAPEEWRQIRMPPG